ncbi:MAG: HAMP domain-containing protein [Anaerolineae bacterium]|nr:HAMP domain-containing protein [Anaerolineae bacterium]
MNLYQKELLGFALVILIAVVTVAVMVGQRTMAEFQHYTVLYTNRAQNLAETLVTYYAEHGSWDAVQTVLATTPGWRVGRRSGQNGIGGESVGAGNSAWDYRVVDVQGRIVADSQGILQGQISQTEIARGLPLTLEGNVIGYLLPDTQGARGIELDAPATQFLDRVQHALVWGGLIAFLAAMLVAGLFTRSIVAPIHDLTGAARTIAGGDLDARAQIRGHDEIAHLAETFNGMATSLQQAEQARQAQTADIAHELRNPLAILQGTLEALADGIYDPTQENIQPALDQVRTLNRLVEDLRTLALADAGQLQLDPQPLEIGGLVRRVGEAHRERLAEKGIALHLEIAAKLPIVSADYDRITQVLNNILGNAARYLPGGTEVHIRGKAENGGVAITVADNGPGVQDAALPHLFDRFWRADPSRSRATGGSGLGLAIARHILQAHRGRIWAEKTPGGGLTVKFWLPS